MVKPRRWLVLLTAVLVTAALAPAALAHPDGAVTDDPNDAHEHSLLERESTGAALQAHDAATDGVVSDGPFADVTKNLAAVGFGERNVSGATTDVWAHNGYAYTGTFNSPCGGDPEAGVWVWDVQNKNKPSFVTIIESPVGSRSNDVKAATMNAGEILVHSNESCDGGPGGFEVYDVSDPANPSHLSSVRIDELNPISDFLFGGITDVGVHNLFLFTQGSNDYVGVTSEGAFDNFRIYDITDPSSPSLVSGWGAEELFDPGVGDETVDVGRVLDAALWLLDGFGASANRFLHDTTVTADGQHVYLANWDAGLILLDISDPADPQVVSVAIDPTSEDGEVNSHSVWPSEDGMIVVEGEEDFSPFASVFTIDTGPNAGEYAAAEGSITSPIVNEPGQEMSGATTYVGLACDINTVPPGSGIALIQRGECAFTVKINNAETAGYDGVVVFNSAGDALVTMGGDPVDLPGVFVGRSTGLAIAGVGSAADLVVGAPGEEVTAAAIVDGWSGFRIWDYSDPANPVLASTFNTVCSATVVDPSCDPAGTYSSHNVIVETNDDGRVMAYISWYNDGIVIIDVTDPYNPVETARYLEAGQDFWGIDKIPGEPWIYGGDRNGGLVIVKELGSGSAKNGKATP